MNLEMTLEMKMGGMTVTMDWQRVAVVSISKMVLFDAYCGITVDGRSRMSDMAYST